MDAFSYSAAFTRNIGWVTEWEQQALRCKKVAIAGMGGVGGAHLLTLTRLGIGSFNIADFDTFDIVNFNRQVGATMTSLGRKKIDVMAEMALGINPDLRIGRFAEGVTPENSSAFLDGVDLFVDGFDFFELEIRRLVFRRCRELGIPAITAAPIGMGTNWLLFTADSMAFDSYFGLEGCAPSEQYLRFLMGLAPHGGHRKYLVDSTRVDLERKIGPSTGASCQLCAGVVGVEALKLLLRRGNARAAPVHHHFDPYLGTFRRTRLRWGMSGPVQRAKLFIARRIYLRRSSVAQKPPAPAAVSPIEQVLDFARWAPSGDNTQPWRFEIIEADRVRIHFQSSGDCNPYEYRGGEPSLLALGMLIETIRLAASTYGRAFDYAVEPGARSEPLRVDVRIPATRNIVPDPLAAFVPTRSVNRWPMRTRRLTVREKLELERALSPEFRVRWFETASERLAIARLSASVTDIRLRAPELFDIHKHVIDWQNVHSPHGLPARTIGLDRATLGIMRWAMGSWTRMRWLNRLTGTAAARAQLDLWPGFRSAAFFAIPAVEPSGAPSVEATLRAGAAIQRFWLTGTKLGLTLQPAAALLMIAHQGSGQQPLFTTDPTLGRKIRNASRVFPAMFGGQPEEFIFVGRIGEPKSWTHGSRSVRRSWSELARDE